MCFEIAAAFIGNRVGLAAFALVELDVARLFEQLQGWVHDARARAVGAAAALFDGLDDLVAVALALGEHVQHEITHAAAFCAWWGTEEIAKPISAASHSGAAEWPARAERSAGAGPVFPMSTRASGALVVIVVMPAASVPAGVIVIP